MPRLTGLERLNAKRQLKACLLNAPKSLGVLISMGQMFEDDAFLDTMYAKYIVDMESYMVSGSRMLKNFALKIHRHD